ncbi:MAG: ParE family toxin-like protein [Thermoanaerobaculia bacterium]
MKSHINSGFRKLFAALPAEIQEQARSAYRLFRINPRHPSLNFKQIHASDRYVSARVGRSYRAVGVRSASDEVLWFWIGPHEEYEKILYML